MEESKGEKGFAPDAIYDDVDDKTRADKTFVTGLCGDRGVSPPLICQVPLGGNPPFWVVLDQRDLRATNLRSTCVATEAPLRL